ncbi:MAG: type II CAAX endopeptidase family protein [Oscillospiraceae bacterium]
MSEMKEKPLEDYSEDEHIIDVVEAFYCENQDAEYNEAYKKWRSDEENEYVYTFVNDTREMAYLEGQGFIEKDPSDEAKKTLKKYMLVIGIAVLASLFVSFVGPFVFAGVFSLFGDNVRYDFFTGIYNLTDTQQIIVNMVLKTLRTVAPMLVIFFVLKIPTKVAFPLKVVNKDVHKSAIPITLVLFVVGEFGSNIFGIILNSLNIKYSPFTFFLPENNVELIVMMLFDILVISTIEELLFHGVIMQSMRQFGDGFAILASSTIAALSTCSIDRMLYIFIVSIGVGYVVLHSGSLYTGILMRIVLHACMFLSFYYSSIFSEETARTHIILFYTICIVTGFFMLVMTVRKQKDFCEFEFKKMYLSTRDELKIAVTSQPIIFACLVICYIFTILSVEIVH